MMQENRKEFKQKIRQRKKELFQEKCEKDSRVLQGQSIVRKVWSILIFFRILVTILGVVMIVWFQIPNINLIKEIFSIIVLMLYAYLMINFGGKNLGFLGLLGGIIPLLSLLRLPFFEIIQFVPIGLKIYFVVAIMTAIGQVIAMLYLMLGREVKIYFQAQEWTVAELNDYIMASKR